MPKPKHATYGDRTVDLPERAKPTEWSASHGMYIAGRAYIDEADYTASQMEVKWGAGRLRLLVSPELREKFDRQRYKLNQAIWHGQLEDVREQAGRMVKAWMALDRAAEAAGAERLDPLVWEHPMANGTVLAVVPDGSVASMVQADGRRRVVYTMAEVARLVAAEADANAVKLRFPGSTVVAVGRDVTDPLHAIHDTSIGIDDMIPF